MKLKEECGIFGGYCFAENINFYIKSGLIKLQHRGQDACGICACGDKFYLQKKLGLVQEKFDASSLKKLKGQWGVGHVRYSTNGSNEIDDVQPFLAELRNVAMAHNGHILGNEKDSKALFDFITPYIFKNYTARQIGELLAEKFPNDAWNLLFLLEDRIWAFKDPKGYRPLMLCEAEEGYFIASEDVAFQGLKNKKIIEVEAGEGIELTKNGFDIFRFNSATPKQCVFEQIYFASSESTIFGKNVAQSRFELGVECAKQNIIEADMVIPVPDSGNIAANGFSSFVGIPLVRAIKKNIFSNRTFIANKKERKSLVEEKLIIDKKLVKGKNVVVIDDSIVRGTTSTSIIKKLKEAGAKKIHFIVSSPQIVGTCFWGVDIPDAKELLVKKNMTNNQIAKFIGSDSVGFLSIESLKKVLGEKNWCTHCLYNEASVKMNKCNKELTNV